MKALRQSTLFFWLLCYIGGIVLSLIELHIVLFIVVFLLFSIGIALKFQNKRTYLYFIFSTIFGLLGHFTLQLHLPNENPTFPKNENYYIGVIEQQITKENVWNSSIVRVRFAKNNNNKWDLTNHKVLLITEKGDHKLTTGSVILFNTTFLPITQNNNPGEFNTTLYWLSKQINYQGFSGLEQITLIDCVQPSLFEQVLDATRNYSEQLLDKWIGKEYAPLMKAMLLGDKSDLTVETKRIFTNTGSMHMLAVSGLHVGVIVMLLLLFFKYAFNYRAKQYSLVLVVFILWFYAFLTGFSPSVTRAVLMFSVLIIAGLLKREYIAINSLSIAAFFILLLNPLAILDIGFQLSFLAMLGIFTIYLALESVVDSKYKLINTIWQGTAVGLAAQVFTVPISLYYFNQFPNYFMITNLGVMLFSGILLGFSIGIIVIGKTILALPLGWALALCSAIFISFIAYIEQIPGALALGFTPTWYWVIVCYIFVFFLLYGIEKRWWKFLLLVFIPLYAWLQYDRYNNHQTREWVVFNSRFPTLLINDGEQLICMHTDSEKGYKQALRLSQDYAKIHPSNVRFIPMQNGSYHFKSKQKEIMKITIDRRDIFIAEGQENYYLSTRINHSNEAFESGTKLISFSHQLAENAYYSLQKGAFRKKISF